MIRRGGSGAFWPIALSIVSAPSVLVGAAACVLGVAFVMDKEWGGAIIFAIGACFVTSAVATWMWVAHWKHQAIGQPVRLRRLWVAITSFSLGLAGVVKGMVDLAEALNGF